MRWRIPGSAEPLGTSVPEPTETDYEMLARDAAALRRDLGMPSRTQGVIAEIVLTSFR